VRLLFFGDLDSTGFGTVTMDLGKALIDKGVDVRFVSQNKWDTLPEPFYSNTLDATTLTFEADAENPNGAIQGMLAFTSELVLGNAAAQLLVSGEPWGDWKPDAVLLLGDFYGVRLMVMPHLAAFSQVPTFHYAPIEGHDLPPFWNEVWKIIAPIAMSEFGQREIAKVIGRMPPMMYHGVDSEVFRPVTALEPLRLLTKDRDIVLTSKERCKAFFGIHPRAKVVLRCDRNMPRKNYPALLRAMEPVMKEREDVVLTLHCASMDQGGFIHDSISKMDPSVRARIMTPDWGPLPREALVALYNAADLYVSTSAEGFGLTIAEAIACGTPAVGLDYSAVPEVIGPAGKTVPVGRLLDNEYGHHWALPDEDAFGRTVAYLLDHPSRARELGYQGPKHVRETFTWEAAADVMIGQMEPARELVAV
jgi:glycosyltransferase involved in cell wall biosynthesis